MDRALFRAVDAADVLEPGSRAAVLVVVVTDRRAVRGPFGVRRFSAAFGFLFLVVRAQGTQKTKAAEKRRTPKAHQPCPTSFAEPTPTCTPPSAVKPGRWPPCAGPACPSLRGSSSLR